MHIPYALAIAYCLIAHALAQNWKHAPIVVGGTGGSGTRGVLDVLQKLSVYMVPDRKSRFIKKCYNGEPLDNGCMVPVGAIQHDNDRRNNMSNYYNWLVRGTCSIRNGTTDSIALKLSSLGQEYMDTVPRASRFPLRWGWKIPTTMYNLDRIFELFPGLVYIQAVRNPLDMASTFYEHLPYRVREFQSIHSGYENAASVLKQRCAIAKHGKAGNCALASKELMAMGGCSESLKNRKHCNLAATSEGWRCLEMQLWAEINYGGKY